MTTEFRTGMEILEPPACWALLREAQVGRLAVAIADHPDIFPVNFVVDHASVVFRTAEGTKLAAAVLGQAVAFEVDGYDADPGEAWSVVVKGQAKELELYAGPLRGLGSAVVPLARVGKPRFVRIEPAEVTGRRFHVVEPPASRSPRARTSTE